MDKFIKDIHYYMDDTRVVFTALYHIERGYCCGNKCINCAYNPKYQKNNKILAKEFIKFKDNLENEPR